MSSQMHERDRVAGLTVAFDLTGRDFDERIFAAGCTRSRYGCVVLTGNNEEPEWNWLKGVK